MSERGARWSAGIVMTLAGLAIGFLAGGLLARSVAGTTTGLAGAATVAIAAVAGGVLVALAAAWLASRATRRALLPLALLLASTAVTLALVTGVTSGRPRADSPPATDSVPTATTITVTGGDSLLGLLRLGPVTDGSGLLPQPLDLHGGPGDSTTVLTTVTRWSDLLAEEIGYEEPAMAVFRTAHPWYLVATRDSIHGWIRLPEGASVVALVDLLPDRLTYLTGDWDGTLRDAPGAGPAHPVTGLVRDHGEASVEVHGARQVGDALWLHVAVHRESPCESAGEPTVLAEGWVPVWTAGKPTVWYYSRGC